MQNKKVFILGGGFGGMYTALGLNKLGSNKKGVYSTLISKENYFLFTPLLHEVATGSVNQQNIIQPVRQVLSCLTEFVLDEVKSVDLNQKVIVANSGEFKYDYLVLALGSTSADLSIGKFGFQLKTLDDAFKLKNHVLGLFEQASKLKDKQQIEKLLTIIVMGGGPTGVEIASELSEFTSGTLIKFFPSLREYKTRIVLIQSQGRLLAEFDIRVSTEALKVLTTRHKIEVKLSTSVKETGKDYVLLDNGERIETQTQVLAFGVKGNDLDLGSGISRVGRNQIEVDEFLRVKGQDSVFALGDIAYIKDINGKLVPQTAQSAVQEAEVVAWNILALNDNSALKPFVYKEKGQLVSLGRFKAAALIADIFFAEFPAWWAWRTIYASKLIGFGNRIRTIIDWTMDLFYPRDTSKLD